MAVTLLIIDDNVEILEFLSLVFSDNYKVYVAEDASAALTILDNEMVDLIISDIMMPGINGFEMCRSIKSNMAYCHIPVILLTSKNTYKAHIEGLEVGADAYVQKPFDDEFLQLQVENLLNNRSKVKEHFASSPFEDVRVVACSKNDEIFLKKLDEYIRGNIRDPHLDVDQLAAHMNMSRPTFYRKVKSLSSLSPKELVDITRLKKAARMIADGELSLAKITEMVGYNSQRHFNRIFLKYFKMSPLDYLRSLPRS